MTKPVRERSHTGFFSYVEAHACKIIDLNLAVHRAADVDNLAADIRWKIAGEEQGDIRNILRGTAVVSYTHLRAHETPEHLVCRLLLEKKKQKKKLTKYKLNPIGVHKN